MIYQVSSVAEFSREINKNVYCFGAGKIFDAFMEKFKWFKLENNVKAIVDNHTSTMRSLVKAVNGICIPIISLEQMLSEMKETDCILITTAAYEEIVTQTAEIRKLDFIKYYIYWVMDIEQYDYERLQIKVPDCLSTCKNQEIPKTIHYCWFGEHKISAQCRKWMESWSYYCPGYEIIEWNEKNYNVHKNRYISQAYGRKKWAFVSDYARIDIVNEYGGIYLDTDVELVKNIDEMLMNNGFCGFESNQYVNYGLGFGAKKNHPILGDMKAYYDSIDFILEDGTTNQTTCPVMQTTIMKKYGLKCDGEFQVVEGMAVYPSRVLSGMSPHSFRIGRNTTNTYAIHHYEGSWVDLDYNQWKSAFIAQMKKWSKDDNYIYPCL